MTRREQLQDRYEDARFALLMDELGAAEGQWAQGESDRLNADGSAAVPEDLDRRCTQTIRREFAKRHLRSAGRFTAKALKGVALAAGIAAILFTTAFAMSETVRVNTMNWIVQVFDTNTDFRFTNSRPNDVIPQMEVGWLPEGYVLESSGYSGTNTWYQYQNSEDEMIYIEYSLTSGTGFGIDTEDAKVSHLDIRNSQAMLVEKEESGLQLVWATEDNTGFIGIIGYDISREDILHIADELRY